MRLFAISDLHLSFGVDKPMDIFGEQWVNHAERMQHAWDEMVTADDWVLVSASAGMNFYNGNNADANGTHRVPRAFSRTQADDPIEQNQIYKAVAEKASGTSMRASTSLRRSS